MKLLDGKRIIVTGGSRGLGRAIVLACARHGARVAFSYAKNQEAAEKTRADAAELGAQVLSFQADAADSAATEQMVKSVETSWEGVDVLVNNAAITQNLPLALLEQEDFERVIRVNVTGPYVTSRAVLRGMIRRKSGVIVNIGSLAGARMIEAPIHYTTSKAGLIGMTEAMAKEVARHGIRVVCLAPGLLEDGLGRNLPDHRLADYLKHNALGRVGTFDEVAELCVLLASNRASYMTGETVVIDGGV
jgi:NAD(P)-dependent dehydrogenase (short-subunit alcohol dehydrogenase family)